MQALDQRRHQTVTHLLGQTLLGAYLIMAVTVMVNMLIAMMSRSFQIVEVGRQGCQLPWLRGVGNEPCCASCH